jgi:DMSO/TMAO reductase YedYZ molybdopterin-dependent catalytic subunit/thiosulfate reductase cytochrome b subunit
MSLMAALSLPLAALGPTDALDFPAWLRITHFLNFLFITFLMRSGLEILSAHPKLYGNDHCTPGSEWLRFTRKRLPAEGLWTSRDEEESFSSWVALPGRRHLGLGRLWHFSSVAFWILTGLGYVVLLFATGEWRRLIPTSWEIVPQAWQALLGYLSLHLVEAPRYNGLQQLTYAAVVFLLSPLAIATGAAMSPAVAGRFPRYTRFFGGRQKARSLHFLCLAAFLVFLVVHVSLVVAHGLGHEFSLIVLGRDVADRRGWALVLGFLGIGITVALHAVATRWSLRSPRQAQEVLGRTSDPWQRLLLGRLTSRQRYGRAEISPYFRVNGRPPADPVYDALVRDDFADWALEVGGLVAEPRRFSLAELRALPRATQITKHDCIQGWSGIAEWSGVALGELLARCRPLPGARYLVFHAFDDKSSSEPDPAGAGHYYETIDLAQAAHPQALLAYEMNGRPLAIVHGAPLRLRLETSLGFKMVKYLRAIELVADYRTVGQGRGGWREDVQHYSRHARI